jgi:predicted amidohydrolase YtcJ
MGITPSVDGHFANALQVVGWANIQRPLDKADLDPLFPDNPVMVLHNSNHGAVLNSCGPAAPSRRAW